MFEILLIILVSATSTVDCFQTKCLIVVFVADVMVWIWNTPPTSACLECLIPREQNGVAWVGYETLRRCHELKKVVRVGTRRYVTLALFLCPDGSWCTVMSAITHSLHYKVSYSAILCPSWWIETFWSIVMKGILPPLDCSCLVVKSEQHKRN